MVRKVHSEGLRERQNMRDAAASRKNGNWCIVGFCDDWEDGFGLQGKKYESEQAAEERAREISNEDEYEGVEHRVMTHSEFEELCEERGVDRNYPW